VVSTAAPPPLFAAALAFVMMAFEYTPFSAGLSCCCAATKPTACLVACWAF
jgi:hypothetical protein